MSLSTRYGFADAPTSAIIGNGSLAWTTSTGALAAAGTSLTVLSSAAFPAALEFDVIIGVRDPTTNEWASAEIRHVTVVSGTTWTVSAGSLDHVSGSDISHVLTATALTHNPGALTDTGDLPYLLSTGRMGRLGAPANGTYSLTWASGVPSWTAVSSGITFPDLAAPPSNTALGASGTPFGAAFLGTTAIGQGSANTITLRGAATGSFPSIEATGSDAEVSLWLRSKTGTSSLPSVVISNIDPATFSAPFLTLNSAQLVSMVADCVLNCPDMQLTGVQTYNNPGVYYANVARGSVAAPTKVLAGDITGVFASQALQDTGIFIPVGEFDFLALDDAAAGSVRAGWQIRVCDGAAAFPNVTSAAGDATSATFIGTVTATDFIVRGSRFMTDTTSGHTASLAAWNGSARVNVATWTNAATPTLDLLSTTTMGSAAIATETYVNAQGFVTATSATAFTNKTGAISQWTNDSNFTTLAAVAGVGYVPGTRTVNGHALSSNVTVTASDLSLGSVENAAASGLYVPLTRTVNGHALSGNINVTASDLSLGSVENTALSTWAGSTNLTTLGTIATGTWSGTAIAANKGGTGQTVYVVGDLLQASTTTALSMLAAVATGNALISGGVGTVSAWGKVGLTTHVSGILPTANGGTGIAFFTAAGPTQARIYTFPDAAATIARTDAGQTFTGHQTIEGVTSTGATGTGKFVFDGSPTLVTPVLGVATATSLNGNTFTTGTYTLTGQAGKTLTFNGSITLTGTDAQTYTFPTTSATIARTDAANTFTGVQTLTSPALTTPAITTSATVTNTAIGAVSTDGLLLINGQPALTGAQQWSPRVHWSGQGFKSNSVSASQTVEFIAEVQPVQGATGATANLVFSSQLAGAGYGNTIVFGSDGGITTSGQISGFVMTGTKLRILTGSNFEAIATGMTVASTSTIGWSSSNNATSGPDTMLVRGGAAATVQHGVDLNGAAISQTIATANGITGQNKTGGNLTIASGKGTDLGAVSSIILQTPTVGGATNGTAQALATRLTIDSSGLTIADAMNLIVNATTGTKIGTATSQKLGFWNATPIIQPVGAGQAAYTDSTGGVAAASLVDVTTAAVSDPVKVNANFATVSVLLLAMRTALLNTGLMKGAA